MFEHLPTDASSDFALSDYDVFNLLLEQQTTALLIYKQCAEKLGMQSDTESCDFWSLSSKILTSFKGPPHSIINYHPSYEAIFLSRSQKLATDSFAWESNTPLCVRRKADSTAPEFGKSFTVQPIDPILIIYEATGLGIYEAGAFVTDVEFVNVHIKVVQGGKAVGQKRSRDQGEASDDGMEVEGPSMSCHCL
jgi:hypothetical protein